MAFRIFFLFLILLVQQNCADIVNIEGLGQVEGIKDTTSWTSRNIYNFYNIPYAQSPSITGRFKEPVKILPWNGIYNATIPRRLCPQILLLTKLNLAAENDEDLEDCLTLNVFTPQITCQNDTLLPVMVYIYGGGFYEGSSSYFPPNYLLEKDIVLVVPQYRLSPFGTLSLNVDNAPGNALFFDQLLALEWVNQHIKDFCGDSEQVTLFGQSAGAASVNMMLISPIVDPKLFQQAILQSGSATANWVIQDNPTDYAVQLYNTLIGKPDESADSSMILEKLENSSVVEILTAFYSLGISAITASSRAVVQKAGQRKFITNHPLYYLQNGQYRPVPMIAGITKNDGSYFTTVLYDVLETFGVQNNPLYLKTRLVNDALILAEIQDNSGAVADIFKDKYLKAVFDEKPNLNFSDVAPGIIDMLGASFMKSPTLQHAKANALLADTYFYTFDYKGEHTRFGYGLDTSKYPFQGGVHHSDDLLYLFPYHYELPLNEDDTEISKLMVDFWTTFAINGYPESNSTFTSWQPMTKVENGPYLHINNICNMDDDFVHNELDITTKQQQNKNKSASELIKILVKIIKQKNKF